MSQGGYVVRLRGLPWSAKTEEITRFLCECAIKNGPDGVHFTFSKEGRPSGEAFVELESEDDVTHALAQNNEHIGNRYIEVFRVEKSEMDWILKHNGVGVSAGRANPDAVVKLRGLPFGCSREEIAQFFAGLEIVSHGIMLTEEQTGRNSGEAYVQFASPEIAEKSLSKHKERIGHRYIEIFKSSLSEANNAARGGGGGRPMMGPRPGPYDRGDRGFNMMNMGMNAMMNMGYGGRGRGRNIKGFYDDESNYDDFSFNGGGMGYGMRNRRGGNSRGGRGGMGMGGGNRMGPNGMYVSKTGHSVHMRGLPFSACENDVFDFFAPIQPVKCVFDYDDNNRPTGEANVDFVSHSEALEAMKKHKHNMQHRYIELFLNSEQSRGGGPGGYGGGNFNDFQDDIGPGFGQNSGSGFGGGYGSGSQGFGGNQGSSGFGGQGMNSYDVGGGYGDSGGMMNNYTAF